MDSQKQSDEIIAALCLLDSAGTGEEGRDLTRFMGSSHQATLLAIMDRLDPHGDVDQEKMLSVLRRLTNSHSDKKRGQDQAIFSAFKEFHPGWILEGLMVEGEEAESSRVLSLLSEFLSDRKAREIMEYLAAQPSGSKSPRVLRMQEILSAKEGSKVSREILDLVQSLLEEKLVPLAPVREGSSFTFQHILWMQVDDLHKLFRDLGQEEIRKAFTGVEPKVLRAFLGRFSPRDALEIRNGLATGASVSPEIRREARHHIVSLPLEQISSEDIFEEIGYSVLARAIAPEELNWADLICKKMMPRQGYRLKRLLHEGVASRPVSVFEARKNAVVRRLLSLAEKGIIRRYWKA